MPVTSEFLEAGEFPVALERWLGRETASGPLGISPAGLWPVHIPTTGAVSWALVGFSFFTLNLCKHTLCPGKEPPAVSREQLLGTLWVTAAAERSWWSRAAVDLRHEVGEAPRGQDRGTESPDRLAPMTCLRADDPAPCTCY